MKKISACLLTCVSILVFVAQANATLLTVGTARYSFNAGLDYNLIYDDDLGIVWLDYTRGHHDWQSQVSWAAGLNNPGVLTYKLNSGVTVNWTDGWRLPTSLNPNAATPCLGYNCIGSELGHMYYSELGNTAGGPLNTGVFLNLLAGTYWSSTEHTFNTYDAWSFYTSLGFQTALNKNTNLYSLAVRHADVAAVPEPSTILLLGSGFSGFILLRKINKIN